MAQAAPYLTRLRFLSVYGAMLSKECCQVLAVALPDFVLLESLQLGRKKGGIDAAGALALVAAARTGGRVTRLGLHNIEAKAAISPVLEALQQYPGLKELAMTGPLDEACAIQLWSLLTADASCLRVLDLENCGLNEQQIENLAEAMKSSGHLQELRLARQQFTDKGARKLARAVRASTGLLRLTLDDCSLDPTTQARSLGAGIATNKSLLELTLLIPDSERRYADRRTSNIPALFRDAASQSSTLLHFGVSSDVVDGWSHGYWNVIRNRMR
jgi:Ran GTPase-activating protein (RanGAP) involved in mRNA processing and transport